MVVRWLLAVSPSPRLRSFAARQKRRRCRKHAPHRRPTRPQHRPPILTHRCGLIVVVVVAEVPACPRVEQKKTRTPLSKQATHHTIRGRAMIRRTASSSSPSFLLLPLVVLVLLSCLSSLVVVVEASPSKVKLVSLLANDAVLDRYAAAVAATEPLREDRDKVLRGEFEGGGREGRREGGTWVRWHWHSCRRWQFN